MEANIRRIELDASLPDERAKDAYLAGEFSVDELLVRRRQTEEAKEEIMLQIDAPEKRGERLRQLIDLRNRL